MQPYDTSIEFPRDRLTLGKQIGAGAFGRVLIGAAVGKYMTKTSIMNSGLIIRNIHLTGAATNP